MSFKKWLAASSLLLAACGGPVEVEAQEPGAPPAEVESSPGEHSAQWFYCSHYNGKTCTVPEYTFTCYNQYPYEPGICRCVVSTYECG